MMRYWVPDYEHLKCGCGGVIGMTKDTRNNTPFTCGTCGKIFNLYELNYDRLLINDKTGWLFPVRNRKE